MSEKLTRNVLVAAFVLCGIVYGTCGIRKSGVLYGGFVWLEQKVLGIKGTLYVSVGILISA